MSTVTTGNLVEIGKVGELQDGVMKQVMVKREVFLARVGNKYYAAESRCPHMRGDLSQGNLEGTVVTCPLTAHSLTLLTVTSSVGQTIPVSCWKRQSL